MKKAICKRCGGNMKYDFIVISFIEECDEFYKCEDCGVKISLHEAEEVNLIKRHFMSAGWRRDHSHYTLEGLYNEWKNRIGEQIKVGTTVAEVDLDEKLNGVWITLVEVKQMNEGETIGIEGD